MTSEQFERLADRCRPGLMTFCKGISENPDDLVQDVFVRAWQKRDSFEQGRSFFSWCCTIASNIAKDHLKTKSRRPQTCHVEREGESNHLLNGYEELRFDPAPWQEGTWIDAETLLSKESAEVIDLVRKRLVGIDTNANERKYLNKFRKRISYFDPRRMA